MHGAGRVTYSDLQIGSEVRKLMGSWSNSDWHEGYQAGLEHKAIHMREVRRRRYVMYFRSLTRGPYKWWHWKYLFKHRTLRIKMLTLQPDGSYKAVKNRPQRQVDREAHNG